MARITTLLTIVTFGIAVCTPPFSGPFCKGPCFQYPYLDIAGRFPRDYYWMYPAIALSFSYLFLIISIYQVAPDHKKIFGLISLSIAIMATLVLSADYFIQVSVIQPSLLAGETDGISVLTQFNPHGIFIVLEEMGFLLMIFSFFALLLVFNGATSIGKAIRWTVIAGFVLAIVSLVLVSMVHGIKREYRFEVIVISITWFELILFGLFLTRYLKKKLS